MGGEGGSLVLLFFILVLFYFISRLIPYYRGVIPFILDTQPLTLSPPGVRLADVRLAGVLLYLLFPSPSW